MGMKPGFIGIRRKTEFSPNHVENDLLIINRTADNLRQMGADVTLIDEAELASASLDGTPVFSMVQGPAGTEALKTLNARHPVLIINSPQSVQNCYRCTMVTRLPEMGVPFPHSSVIATDKIAAADVEFVGEHKIWVKRGDVHAVHREDVVLAYNGRETLSILREFRTRGIKSAVLQEHIDGDTVKFYAVKESSFFHWYYLNGKYHTAFNVENLRQLAVRSADILGLFVYGGDAIIRPDGGVVIIDINDWPSFAPVREDASREIAQLIFRKAEEYANGKNDAR
jgi:glutathione synthase/RimK-type ligase-like ATP-grasp enzyme